ncbi:RING finger protein 37-like [Oppia nitens]|uniref:RING finger protein 37-like n=1 Tax=Oppia nitens TaxID=1686743 RepID=UPI0023DCA757|nr:RING finger protein 37-like [Oppia nitens]
MSINLLTERLVRESLVSVQCTQVTADHHSVANLYSDDQRLRQQGFRTENFVRPPVDIIINCRGFAVNLRELEIGLRVGQNKCHSLEVWSLYGSSAATTAVASGHKSQDFQLIGRQFNCNDFDVLCLRNVSFRPNNVLNGRLPDKCSPDNCPNRLSSVKSETLKCFKNCFNIQSLKIRILRTFNSTVPCLSFVNIMCQPVRQTDPEILSKLRTIFTTQNSGQNVPKTVSFYNSGEDQTSSSETKSSSTSVSNNNNNNNCDPISRKRRLDWLASQRLDSQSTASIPEEFIDCITNEIMIDPVLLPSGHSIDKTTLERYLAEEAKWCRRPSDPFTQLVFTGDRHPKPNYILKQRIDEFLSQLSEQSVISDDRLEPSTKRRIVGYNCVNNRNKLISSKLVATDVGISNTTNISDKLESNSSIVSNVLQQISCHQKCIVCNVDHWSADKSIDIYKLLCCHLICGPELRSKVAESTDKMIECNDCKCLMKTNEILKVNRFS